MVGAVALVAVALTGCTLIPGYGDCKPVYESGDSSSLVTAEGSFGVKPTVDFPTPLRVNAPEVSVIDAGDGALIPAGAQVDYTMAEFLGEDGQTLSGDVAANRTASGVDDDAVSEALVCAHVGDRIALVTSAASIHGEGAGEGSGIADEDALVLVIDISAAYLGKADGFNQLPQDGMPTVVTAVDGTPGVSVLLQEPPTETRSSVIKAGDGAKLKEGDTIVTHYAFWTWPATEGDEPVAVDGANSWTSHKAANLPMEPLKASGGLPLGIYDALLGQRIGSQVLIVLTPGDDGFPAGQGLTGNDDDIYIMVFDLLGIQK